MNLRSARQYRQLCDCCAQAFEQSPSPRVLCVGDFNPEAIARVRERFPTVTLELKTVADLRAEEAHRRARDAAELTQLQRFAIFDDPLAR